MTLCCETADRNSARDLVVKEFVRHSNERDEEGGRYLVTCFVFGRLVAGRSLGSLKWAEKIWRRYLKI